MLPIFSFSAKLPLPIAICLTLAIQTVAQTNLNIYQNDGNVWQIPLSEVDSLTYTAGIVNGSVSVVTTLPSGITHNTVSTGGTITTNGQISVLYRGICLDTVPEPTLASILVADPDSGQGSFNVDVDIMNGLLPSTSYYVRAYAAGSNWTIYGNEIVFSTDAAYSIGGGVTDVDGNYYNTVIIGTQEWAVENLRTTRYANGDTIWHAEDPALWEYGNSGATIGKYCWYENDSTYEIPYGKLYNWYVASDPRNACPVGWHVSTDEDWNTLSFYLDPYSDSLCIGCLFGNTESTYTGGLLKSGRI